MMNISLSDELGAWVETRAQAGNTTASLVVEDLVREDLKRKREMKLHELLIEGLDSGEPLRADERFWQEFRQEALDKMSARRSGR